MGFIVQPQTFFAVGPKRSFGTANQIFSGYVTLSENSSDTLTITKQPVQQGANINDHAFKNPTLFSITIGFSSSLTKSLAQIYQDLLNLQNSITPITCTTPKRTYNNMLVGNLAVTTDKKSENILSVSCSFEQIILVPLSVGNIDPSKLKTPASSQATQAVGQKQSFLSGIVGVAKQLFSGSVVGGGG